MKIKCEFCGDEFEAKRRSARFCSDAHRKRARRGPGGKATLLVLPTPAPATEDPERDPPKIGSCAETTARDLLKAGRFDTPLGQAAMVLANRIDNAFAETGAGLSALVKGLEATLASAMKGADEQGDVLDEILESVARKTAGL